MTEAMSSLAALRAEFPLLSSCTYLNSNSTGPLPRAVEEVLRHYWDTARGWRDAVWEEWLGGVQGYADAVARLLGAPPGSVAMDTNLSSLLGRLGTCFDWSSERRRVVITDLEFPTVPFLWRGFERYGAEVVVVPSENGRMDEARLSAAIDERTRLVCVSHGAFSTGAVLDAARVAKAAHAAGALLALDAYQTVGALPLDVGALDVDFLLGGAHKWLCGAECAFLYARPSLLPTLRTAATGWLAGDAPFAFAPSGDYAPDARRLRSGTPAPLMVLLSRPGLDLIAGVGLETVRARSLSLTARVIARADEAGITVVTPREPHRRGSVVCLRFPGDAETAERLTARGFVCSHRGALRVGPHAYNTADEVDAFMDALAEERARSAA